MDEFSTNEWARFRYSCASGASHYASNDELGWETITERGNLLSLNIFHKIHFHETRPLVRKCMSKLNLDNNYKIRNKGVYVPFPYKGDIFNLSIFPNTTKLWNSIQKQTQLKPLDEFKIGIKKDIKPPKYKHFDRG